MRVTEEKQLDRVVNFIYHNHDRICEGLQAVYFHYNISFEQAYEQVQRHLADNREKFSSVEKVAEFFVDYLYKYDREAKDFNSDAMHMIVFSVYRTDFGKGANHVKGLIRRDIVRYWNEPVED